MQDICVVFVVALFGLTERGQLLGKVELKVESGHHASTHLAPGDALQLSITLRAEWLQLLLVHLPGRLGAIVLGWWTVVGPPTELYYFISFFRVVCLYLKNLQTALIPAGFLEVSHDSVLERVVELRAPLLVDRESPELIKPLPEHFYALHVHRLGILLGELTFKVPKATAYK